MQVHVPTIGLGRPVDHVVLAIHRNVQTVRLHFFADQSALSLNNEVSALVVEEAHTLIQRFRIDLENFADTPHG